MARGGGGVNTPIIMGSGSNLKVINKPQDLIKRLRRKICCLRKRIEELEDQLSTTTTTTTP